MKTRTFSNQVLSATVEFDSQDQKVFEEAVRLALAGGISEPLSATFAKSPIEPDTGRVTF
jgi:hypothetical protein